MAFACIEAARGAHKGAQNQCLHCSCRTILEFAVSEPFGSLIHWRCSKHLDEQAGREEQRQRVGDCSPTAPLLPGLYQPVATEVSVSYTVLKRRAADRIGFSVTTGGASLASKCSSAASEEANRASLALHPSVKLGFLCSPAVYRAQRWNSVPP